MVNKKLIIGFSKLAVIVILASSVSEVAYAKDGDLWKDGINIGGISNVLLHNKSVIFNMIRHMDTYGYEVANKVYDASKVNEKFNSNPDATIEAVQSKITTILTPEVSVSEVMVLSVKATAANSFKVVFNNSPVDISKVEFVLKETAGTAVTTSITWNSSNTEATLTCPYGLTPDNYSVNVKNDSIDLGTSMVVIMQQAVAKIDITSTKLGISSNQNTYGGVIAQNGYATYIVLDQYGNDITSSHLANNIDFQTNVGSIAAIKGLIMIAPADGLNLMEITSGVVITAYDESTAVSTNAILTVQLGTLSDIALGTALTNTDGKDLTAGDTTDIFYLPFTATDISGNPTTNYTLIKKGLILHNVDYLYTSIPYVTAQLKQDPSDSTKAVIVVRAHADIISTDIPLVITAMTYTGKRSQISLTLKKQATLDTFKLMPPVGE
ncbi:hypothetical protein K9O30_01845 [Clostridium bowmanii]|uniref:hypothetical protein n=1 Tax=Clostridium bowmanii TaxID=132925 RepID=UPI001C0C4860|nr:hypothetical protein [Clostridium bowmanii]MBU3190287.1 hypothetical protein [Clostridium bowmanii]MCA1072501.1 hypothetical protein [Clostridium bowmanii]